LLSNTFGISKDLWRIQHVCFVELKTIMFVLCYKLCASFFTLLLGLNSHKSLVIKIWKPRMKLQSTKMFFLITKIFNCFYIRIMLTTNIPLGYVHIIPSTFILLKWNNLTLVHNIYIYIYIFSNLWGWQSSIRGHPNLATS